MHDRVADLDLGQIAQHVLRDDAVGGLAPVTRASLRGVELVFGDDREGPSSQMKPFAIGPTLSISLSLAARNAAKFSHWASVRPYSAK